MKQVDSSIIKWFTMVIISGIGRSTIMVLQSLTCQLAPLRSVGMAASPVRALLVVHGTSSVVVQTQPFLTAGCLSMQLTYLDSFRSCGLCSSYRARFGKNPINC